MRYALAALVLAAAGLALLRGVAALALALLGVAMLISAGKSFHALFTSLGGKTLRAKTLHGKIWGGKIWGGNWSGETWSGNKRAPGASVKLEFDNFGVRDGAILSGPFLGWKLSEMSRVECEAFHAQCRATDSEVLLALEAYFDRRFPGWRAAAQDNSNTGRGGRASARNGEMTEQEAYQTLGLRAGAVAEEIVRAHRTLMKKRHPDHGGTTDDAARLNQAKDRLLRRHG